MASHPAQSRAQRYTLWFMAIGILVPGAYGFIEKFIQFIHTLRADDAGSFTIIPISNYLLVAMGFVCLMAWAIMNGMFRDVEGPKYTMLQQEEDLERLEEAQRRMP